MVATWAWCYLYESGESSRWSWPSWCGGLLDGKAWKGLDFAPSDFAVVTGIYSFNTCSLHLAKKDT